eukprot:TRINITY_DN5132_c0_g1_i1.p1 TRINITY_DN5132_c0_g1~~TRINITY_DN5132_c0_g1_i1.p1  ORF type:complete len:124 (-),score=21.66 TRINITY_DN5132_c0_g1_i1:74-445(-)
MRSGKTLICLALAALGVCTAFAPPSPRHMVPQAVKKSEAAGVALPKWLGAPGAAAVGVAMAPLAAHADAQGASALVLAGGLKDKVIEFTSSDAVLAVPLLLGFLVATGLAGTIFFLSQPAEND